MEAVLAAQQEFADLMYRTVPGVIAITAGVDDNDPLLLHDFQAYANMEVFLGHADMSNVEVRERFVAWINFDNYDGGQPFYGVVWAPAEHVEKVEKMTRELGGARFTVYPIEQVQGSVDLNNWE